ncbi:WD repeat-containing protein 18 [Vespa crabro]|uniref:WD repeat-containing protein 18 n=1 Tax=Vespa crabro TaxID=7445 RepID=UPI001EFF681F|nr:WD repeat-containing protein 18 [Vespa crabro]
MEVIITSDNVAENWSAAVWDPNTGSLLSTYKHATPIQNHTLQMLNDCYLLGADSTKPRLHIWPLNSQRPLSNIRLTTPGKVSALTSTPDGSYIVAGISEKLYVWQVCNGRLLSIITRHYQTVTCLTFTKDSSMFVSGGEDGLIFVWSLFRVINEKEQATALYSFSNHTLPVKDLYVGHCAPRARLCSVSLDRTANIYDLNDGKLLVILVFDLPLTSISMNTKESELFVGCTNGLIFKFDLHEPPRGIEHHVKSTGTNEEDDDSAVYRGHESTIVSLSVSSNCRNLLSASIDRKVHLWDVISRQILRTFGHKGQITSAFFAKRFNNFQIHDLKPSLKIQPLQRVLDNNGKENVIEIIRQGRDTSDILDFDSYVEKESLRTEINDHTSRKLETALEEIEKLKMINSTLYKYSVKCILLKSMNNDQKD